MTKKVFTERMTCINIILAKLLIIQMNFLIIFLHRKIASLDHAIDNFISKMLRTEQILRLGMKRYCRI